MQLRLTLQCDCAIYCKDACFRVLSRSLRDEVSLRDEASLQLQLVVVKLNSSL